jgi:hypothetical protein
LYNVQRFQHFDLLLMMTMSFLLLGTRRNNWNKDYVEDAWMSSRNGCSVTMMAPSSWVIDHFRSVFAVRIEKLLLTKSFFASPLLNHMETVFVTDLMYLVNTKEGDQC